jgi:hypothetical protein
MDANFLPQTAKEIPKIGLQLPPVQIFAACVAGLALPGLGHALIRKWDRAVIFFACIFLLFFIGIQLHGRLFRPEFDGFFSIFKFIADAGSGFLYWIPLLRDYGGGEPTAYTYDYANLFIYVAGLLNMLVVVDVFDIAMGRKQ